MPAAPKKTTKPPASKQAKRKASKRVGGPDDGPLVMREDAPDCGAINPRFIDLFCGIGGFRIAFERAGGRCVFSSDYDKFSQQTYQANFGERPHGDIHSSPQARLRLAGKPRPMLRKE